MSLIVLGADDPNSLHAGVARDAADELGALAPAVGVDLRELPGSACDSLSAAVALLEDLSAGVDGEGRLVALFVPGMQDCRPDASMGDALRTLRGRGVRCLVVAVGPRSPDDRLQRWATAGGTGRSGVPPLGVQYAASGADAATSALRLLRRTDACECHAGEGRCLGEGASQACTDGGRNWAPPTPCPFGCGGTGACHPACRPGQAVGCSADGESLIVCGEEGRPGPVRPCEHGCQPADTPMCHLRCRPGQALACVADRLMTCADDGVSDELVECAHGCDSARRRCHPSCRPGDGLGCVDDETARVCGEEGAGVVEVACDHGCEGQAGRCNLVCRPGDPIRCVGDMLETCGPDGVSTVAMECEHGCDSAAIACYPFCRPGTTVGCDGEFWLVCEDDGRDTRRINCLSMGCDPVRGRCHRVCRPGRLRCWDDDVEICSDGGQAWELHVDCGPHFVWDRCRRNEEGTPTCFRTCYQTEFAGAVGDPWTVEPAGSWIASAPGSGLAYTAPLGDDSVASLELQVGYAFGTRIVGSASVSSEPLSDHLTVELLPSGQRWELSGIDVHSIDVGIPPGLDSPFTLRLRYIKDGAGAGNNDRARIGPLQVQTVSDECPPIGVH